MAEEKPTAGNAPKDEFILWYDVAPPQEPTMMFIAIPLELCANDRENGTALLRGKLDEAKQIALSALQAKRAKKAHAGIVRPGGGPIDPRVH
jgi:hypothetical protein